MTTHTPQETTMSRRTAAATLILLPLLALTSCGDDARNAEPTTPAASPTYSFVEREWLLSSQEQRRRYCKDYLSDDIHTVEYFGYSESDAGRDMLEELLAFLKEKC